MIGDGTVGGGVGAIGRIGQPIGAVAGVPSVKLEPEEVDLAAMEPGAACVGHRAPPGLQRPWLLAGPGTV